MKKLSGFLILCCGFAVLRAEETQDAKIGEVQSPMVESSASPVATSAPATAPTPPALTEPSTPTEQLSAPPAAVQPAPSSVDKSPSIAADPVSAATPEKTSVPPADNDMSSADSSKEVVNLPPLKSLQSLLAYHAKETELMNELVRHWAVKLGDTAQRRAALEKDLADKQSQMEQARRAGTKAGNKEAQRLKGEAARINKALQSVTKTWAGQVKSLSMEIRESAKTAGQGLKDSYQQALAELQVAGR